MKKLNLNLPVSIFVVGAILFALAPTGVITSFTANDIYLVSLLIESIGITVGLVMFYRDKITKLYLEEV